MNGREVLSNQDSFEICLARGYVSSSIEEWSAQGFTSEEQVDLLMLRLVDLKMPLSDSNDSFSKTTAALATAKDNWLQSLGVDTNGEVPPEQVKRESFSQALESELRLAARDPEAFMHFNRPDSDR